MNVRAACAALVVVVALLSAPTPLRMFWNAPANVWITGAPWIWLPTVMVLAALLGHLLVWRRLRADRRCGVDGLAASGVESGTLSPIEERWARIWTPRWR
jgi:hypothetical protein